MKIKRVTPIGIKTPMTSPIKMANTTVRDAESLIVKVEDTDGNVGWGEASEAPMMNGEMVAGMVAAVKFLIPQLEGLEIDAPGDFFAAIRPMIYGNDGAISALDIALYDLFGQATGKPIYELLGGKKRGRIPVLWMLGTSDAEKDAATAKAKVGEGYTAFKIKAGINPAADDVGRCAAIRAAAGKGARLSADANQGFSFLDAISFAEAAAGAGLDFIEQPIDAHNINGMADIVAAAGPVGVCADEGIHNLSDIEAHHMAKAATGCGLKGIKLGGLTRMLEAAELCNDYGLHVNIAGKIAETSIASAAIVHLAHAIPQIDWDISVTCQYVAKDVVKNPVTTVDGHVSVDDAPGLGLEIDEDEIGRVTVIR